MKAFALTLALALLVGTATAAQAPTLSDVDRLRGQGFYKDMLIAQSTLERAQMMAIIAQRDFDDAKAALDALLAAKLADGCDVDREKWICKPTTAAKD